MDRDEHYIHHLVWCTVRSAQSPYGCGVLFICPWAYQSLEEINEIAPHFFCCICAGLELPGMMCSMVTSSKMLMEWVQRSLPNPINEKALESVKDFALIWNLYEDNFFEKKASGKKLFEKNDVKSTEKTAIQLYVAIIDRYIDKEIGRPNKRYPYLFRKKEKTYDNEVKRILLSKTPSTDEINKVCRMVAWRYRCNLFHGNKEAQEIYDDNSLFESLNVYLMDTIMHSKSK